MNKSLSFEHGIKLAHDPKDLATATTGARISMAKGERLTILIAVAAGLAATITPQLKQHDADAAGNSKSLSITNKYLVKKNAETAFTQLGDGVTPYNELVLGVSIGVNKALVAIEVMPTDLDLANGYAYVSVDFPVAGAARLASTVYVVTDAKVKPAYLESI